MALGRIVFMGHKFTSVNDESALDELLARSQDAPVIVFKHSTTCPISSAAYREMSKVEEDIALVIVQGARALSQKIAAQTGVRHESPQAIILRKGQVVWTASHWSITSDAVTAAMRVNA
jgi:bacillithiol system protein YtxJ